VGSKGNTSPKVPMSPQNAAHRQGPRTTGRSARMRWRITSVKLDLRELEALFNDVVRAQAAAGEGVTVGRRNTGASTTAGTSNRTSSTQ
jgi:hypothetical protein